MDIAAIIEKFGYQIALLLFFVWWSYRREQKISERLDKIVDESLKEGREDRIIMTQALNNNTAALDKFVNTIAERPCMIEHK